MNAQTQIARPVRLPSGEHDNKRATFADNVEVPICISVKNDEGHAEDKILGTLPRGSKELYTQHRMCGDYYCSILGKKHVSAIGDTLEAAFTNALAKAA